MIKFYEPHISGGTCFVVMSDRQAIDWWRKENPLSVSLMEYTDDDIIETVIVTHGAEHYAIKVKE